MSRYSPGQNPPRTPCQIVHHLAGYEFPWDITRALELALLKTFCVPRISQLLAHTREFIDRPQKRYDDTGLLVAEMMQWGYEHERGLRAIQRMNAIHSRFAIENSDFLYVLSTFIYEPIRWINAWAWRPLTPEERQGFVTFWQRVGEHMELTDIPATDAAFEAYHDRYETSIFAYTEANQKIAESTRNLFASWFPVWLRPVVRPCADSLLAPYICQHLGIKPQPLWLSGLVQNNLRLRSRLAHQFPPRQVSSFFTDHPTRTYPDGYTIEELGAKADGKF
jgi:hypothetical protein